MWFPSRSDTNRAVQAQEHRRWLEARHFRFRKKRNCTICEAKTKGAELICAFVFTYTKCLFSHVVAQITEQTLWKSMSLTVP